MEGMTTGSLLWSSVVMATVEWSVGLPLCQVPTTVGMGLMFVPGRHTLSRAIRLLVKMLSVGVRLRCIMPLAFAV